jgi:hypothetical protein
MNPTHDEGQGRGAPQGEQPDRALHDELSRLRSAASALTNQTIARRASALAPPQARWRVTDRRLGEWLAGKSVPHHSEALLAVVAVLTEHLRAEAVRRGSPTNGTGQRPDVQRWTALWTAARARTTARAETDPATASESPPEPPHHQQDAVTPKPTVDDRADSRADSRADTTDRADRPSGSLLGPCHAGSELIREADHLAEEVRHDVAAMAGDLTLLSPPPLDVQWKLVRTPPSQEPGDRRALFRALPLSDRSEEGDEQRGRAGLLSAYAGPGSGRLVVLGAPGSGKTGAALLLVLDAIAERELCDQNERRLVPVPVFLRLATWNPHEAELHEWAVSEIGHSLPRYAQGTGQQILRDLLGSGLVSLVLDGVDEMPEAVRRQAVRTLLRRTRSRVVVLGRPEDFCTQGQNELLAGSTVVHLQPITPDSAATYLRGCGCHIDPTPSAASSEPTRSLLRTLTTPLAVALARDEWTAATTPGAAPAHEPKTWLASSAVRRTFTRGRCPESEARAGASLIARRMTMLGVHEFDWWTLPSLMVRRRSFVAAAALAVAAVVLLAHGTLAVLHHRMSSLALSFNSPCPDMTWQGRFAHDLGSTLGHAIGLSAMAAAFVALRLPPKPHTRPAPFFRSRRTRVSWWTLPAGVAVSTAAGAAAGAGLWAMMSMALALGRKVADPDTCRIAPTAVAPDELLPASGRGGILAGLLAVTVLSYIWLAHRRGRVDGSSNVTVALYRDVARVIPACGLGGGALSQALRRRATGDGFSAPFLPRADLHESLKDLVGVADGAVTGLEVGLAVGLGLAMVTAVLTGSPALSADSQRTGQRWRWSPTTPVRPSAVVAALLGCGVAIAVTLQSLGDGQGLPWLVTSALPASAAWVLLRPRGAAVTRREPGSALAADRRFALATVVAALLFSTPFSVWLVRAPQLGVSFADTASDPRVAVCTLVTTLVCAGLFTLAIAAHPLLSTVTGYLRLTGHPVDLYRAVTLAYRGGLLRSVGPRYQFRHYTIQEFLAGLELLDDPELLDEEPQAGEDRSDRVHQSHQHPRAGDAAGPSYSS